MEPNTLNKFSLYSENLGLQLWPLSRELPVLRSKDSVSDSSFASAFPNFCLFLFYCFSFLVSKKVSSLGDWSKRQGYINSNKAQLTILDAAFYCIFEPVWDSRLKSSPLLSPFCLFEGRLSLRNAIFSFLKHAAQVAWSQMFQFKCDKEMLNCKKKRRNKILVVPWNVLQGLFLTFVWERILQSYIFPWKK